VPQSGGVEKMSASQISTPSTPLPPLKRGIINLGFDSETLIKLVYTAASLDNFLLAGVIRMALRADINFHNIAFHGRAADKRLAASASHGTFVIIGMNSFFHNFRSPNEFRPTAQISPPFSAYIL